MQLQLYGKKIWLYREAIDFRKSIDGLSYDELGWLLAGLEWQKMRNWKELDYGKFS